jgi:ABC-2 type transport system permease protein/sodium transport system permease protein
MSTPNRYSSRQPAIDFGRLGRLARKELSESLRDRRTIFTLVLMPLLLYPLLSIGFHQLLLSNTTEQSAPKYRLGFHSREEAASFYRFIHFGEELLSANAVVGKGDGKLPDGPPHREPTPNFEFYYAENLEEAVRTEEIDVGIRLNPPGPISTKPRTGLAVECEMLYRQDSAAGKAAVRYLELRAAAGNARFLHQIMEADGITNQRANALQLKSLIVYDPTAKPSALLPVLVPLILILMTMTGAVYPAIDLTAGERERGTLEILVAAPIPRLSVLFAKYVAVWTVAVLTALINLGTMAITLQVSGIGSQLFGTGFSPLVLVKIFFLLLLFAAFFSALLLVVTSFARSFKEAQAYLIPMMLAALLPGMVALLPGIKLQGYLTIAPLINVVLLSRDIFDEKATLTAAILVVTTTLLYALAALTLAARIFGTEAVLSEQSGWSDFLRRPLRDRNEAPASSALLCLALLFPTNFLLIGTVASWKLPLPQTLLLVTVANIALFAGIPLIAAWFGRVRLVSGFRLGMPRWQTFMAAGLMGACLWPFSHELIRYLESAGFTSLPAEIQSQAKKLVEAWRQIPSPMVVLCFAVVPALVEELFFRGFLFTALAGANRRVWVAGVLSAALFALFHLPVGGALAIERLPPTFLMGCILAWVCWKTGSIWPGVLLHTLNNGIQVLLAYYGLQLIQQGWLTTAERLPVGGMIGAGIGAAVGFLWLLGIGPGQPDDESVS